MAKRVKQAGPGLFDQIEIEEDRAKPEECKHRYEEKTDTWWGAKYGWRMTYTCRACGNIRGRCHG